MKRLAIMTLLAGCAAQPNFGAAVRVPAFGPGGQARTEIDPADMQDAHARGLIIHYHEGDTIELAMHVDSDLAAADVPETITLTVLRPSGCTADPAVCGSARMVPRSGPGARPSRASFTLAWACRAKTSATSPALHCRATFGNSNAAA